MLEKTVTEHYDEEFVKSFTINIDDALDMIDDVNTDKGFLSPKNKSEQFDFKAWPLNSSMVGFMPDVEVKERFEVQSKQTLKLKGRLSITFASAT